MVNSWGDYDHFLSTKIWFMKSYIEPGNTLPILHADTNKGIINFNQQRDYHLRYVLKDVFGNQTVKEFTVRGEPEAIPVAYHQRVQRHSIMLKTITSTQTAYD